MIHASSRGMRVPGAPAARRAGAADQAQLGDDRDDAGLAEHQVGPLLRIVGVDRHVGGAGGQRRQDRDVERVAARRHPDADAVAATDPARGQPLHALLDVGDQLGVGELHVAVVERGCVGMALRRSRTGCRSASAAPVPASDNRYCAGMSGRASVVTATNY